MRLDELADDGEAEAEAAVRAGGGAVGLAKALEDVGLEVRGDADARVRDRDLDRGRVALDEHLDAAAPGRELDRVGQESSFGLAEGMVSDIVPEILV